MILINVAAMAYMLYMNNWQFEKTDINPLYGPPVAILDAYGAKDTSKIVGGEPWRLFSAMFLHLGVIHLGVNMFSLYHLGSDVGSCHGFSFFHCVSRCKSTICVMKMRG